MLRQKSAAPYVRGRRFFDACVKQVAEAACKPAKGNSVLSYWAGEGSIWPSFSGPIMRYRL